METNWISSVCFSPREGDSVSFIHLHYKYYCSPGPVPGARDTEGNLSWPLPQRALLLGEQGDEQARIKQHGKIKHGA